MRLLGLTSILFLLAIGPAYAGRGGGHGGGGHGGGVVVRDHRGGGGGVVVRDHRGGGGPGWHRAGPGPRHVRAGGHIRYVGGRYVFPGGRVFVYKKPKHIRYYDVHVRPPILVETYDTIPGYVWVGGGWTWGGAEWVWTPGYYRVATVSPPSVGISAGISAGVTVR